MEMSLWKALLCKISSFFGLSTSDNFGSELVWKIYQNIEEILKLLKTIVGSIVHSNVASNDMLTQELEQLVWSIDECRHLLENWHPLASRVHHVLQAEVLTTGIQAHVLEIVRLLKDSCQCLPAELSSASLEMCIQKVNNIGCVSTSTIIMKAIQDQAVGLRPERWSEIAHCLGLRSNEDILVENIALEKLMNAKQAENSVKVDYIEQLITLFIHMHNHLSLLKRSRSGVLIPVDFCCPLSLELMRDPVILASGQTYERASIKRWFDLGLTECPKTRQTLAHTNMIPNYTCKALIVNWCQGTDMKLHDFVNSMNEELPLLLHTDLLENNNIPSEVPQRCGLGKVGCTRSLPLFCKDIEVVSSTDLLETGAEIQKLVEDLKSESIENLREITAQLLQFAEQNMDNRILIADSGGIKLLVNLLHSVDPMIQENVVTSLLYLAINDDNKTTMTNAGAIGPLIHVLEIGTSKAQENAAATLFCLSMIKENKCWIGRLGAICPLVELLRNGTPRGKNHAAIALFNLSICHENKGRIVQAGAVKHLVELMNPVAVAGMVDKAVAVLANLATIPEGRLMIGQAGGIPVLVEIVELGSARGKENAAAALLQLCITSSRFCNMVLQEGAVPPLVALSQSGTSRAKEKAQVLLGYFRSQRPANAGRG